LWPVRRALYYHGMVARIPTKDELTAQRDRILAIAAKHGASNVRVIGSVARGDAGPESDFDLLVHFRPGTSLMDHARLIIELEEALGRRVDVADDEGLRPRVRANVMADAVPL
jgi:uncharacterized protein